MSDNKPSKSTPRARSAAGATPPNIALDVMCVVNSAAVVVKSLSCCSTFTENDVLPELLPALRGFLSESLEDVMQRAVRVLLSERGCAHVDLDAARVAVTDVFAQTQPEGKLDDVIETLVAKGVDGERVTWEVIVRESHKHEGLIFKECNRLLRSLPNRTVDELRGYGWLGLRTALRKFDISLGYAFSTYACPRINGAIRDGLRNELPIPKRLTTLARKASKAEEVLTQKLSRTPAYSEILEYLKDEEKQHHLLPRLTTAASLEEMSMTSDGEVGREPACLVEHADPSEEALISLRNEALHDAIGELPEEQREAIKLLMFDELSVREAARRLGVEPRQMSQRKASALKALEPVMRHWYNERVLTNA